MNFERGRSHGASRASERLTRVFLGEMAIADAEDSALYLPQWPRPGLDHKSSYGYPQVSLITLRAQC